MYIKILWLETVMSHKVQYITTNSFAGLVDKFIERSEDKKNIWKEFRKKFLDVANSIPNNNTHPSNPGIKISKMADIVIWQWYAREAYIRYKASPVCPCTRFIFFFHDAKRIVFPYKIIDDHDYSKFCRNCLQNARIVIAELDKWKIDCMDDENNPRLKEY